MNIDGNTKIYGIFGYPVSHTFSPAMQNAAFEKLNINAVYIPFCVRPDKIKSAVQSLSVLGISGVNLTLPHKEICLAYLDSITESAKLIGAVNTISVEEGKLIGHNTDGKGFVTALRKELFIDPKGKSVFIMGAGGAGKAVAMQLILEGAKKLFICDVARDRAQRLVLQINRNVPGQKAKLVSYVGPHIERTIADTDIYINATPVGMKKNDPLLFSPTAFHSKIAICDLIYNPPATKLLLAAKKKKLRAMNGLGMLLHQGALAFGIWTKKPAPISVMRTALLKQLHNIPKKI